MYSLRKDVSSRLKSVRDRLAYIIGGGKRRYRIRRLKNGSYQVQMKGGCTGPFWGFACFTAFSALSEAEYWKSKWSKDNG